MPAKKKFGIYVFNIEKIKDGVLWFDTEQKRDKEYDKLKNNSNFRVEKRQR